MKLLDFLKCFGPDEIVKVVIWEKNWEEEPVFEGFLHDIPWILTEKKIAVPAKTDDWTGVSFRDNMNLDNWKLPGLVITIEDEE